MSGGASVWVLHGRHAGDNAQTVHLATALGVPFEVKPLRYNPLHALPFCLRGINLASLVPASRQLIAPPWPRLVIAVGKRSAPVALHIRRASRGLSTLVHLGRPRAPLSLFDLIVTTPQYGLPRARNVMELALPFAHRPAAGNASLARWNAAWTALPRPLVAVLLGAGKFPVRFGPAEARALAARLHTAFPRGTLLLVASPRTQPPILQTLADRLGTRAVAYLYDPDDNPYSAALQLADRIVVTSDSMSMLADAILSGPPVSIHQLPRSPLALTWSAAAGAPGALARLGFITPPRDMAAVARRLIADGHADQLGAESRRRRTLVPDYAGVVARVRALIPELDRGALAEENKVRRRA